MEQDDSWVPESFKQGMAGDPQIQRELLSINTEFSAADADGSGNF